MDDSKTIVIKKDLLDIKDDADLKEKAIKIFKEKFNVDGRKGNYYKVERRKGEVIGIPMSLLKEINKAKVDKEFLRIIPNLDEIEKKRYIYIVVL